MHTDIMVVSWLKKRHESETQNREDKWIIFTIGRDSNKKIILQL